MINDFFESIAPRSIEKMNELSEELKLKLKKTVRFLGKETTTMAIEKFEKEFENDEENKKNLKKIEEEEKKNIDKTFEKIDTGFHKNI